MSDYWDAIARVARGLPGSAEPRSRSMFESEEPFAAGGVDAVDQQEVEAEPTPIAPVALAPAAPAPVAAPAPADVRTEVIRSPAAPPLESHEPTRDAPPPRAQTRAAEPDQPASSRQGATQAAPAPSEPVARIEVHRTETTRMARELTQIGTPSTEPKAEPTPAVAALPVHHAKPVEPAPVVVEPPAIVVAKPVATVPVPDQASPVPEPPPLVIEIGRIDIRIESETAPPPAAPKRRDAGPTLSLDDFLTRRRGAGA